MAREERPGSLSTFGGVFTPSVLTILGIILFLRLGYVVGNAGLMRALIIIGIANAISILTSISIAAVATNLKVKGGGVYYLISRTLGVEFGGALADPGRSIPLGTFSAVGISLVIYFSAAVLFAGALPLDRLSTDTQAMQQASKWGFLIDIGVISATLSSALLPTPAGPYSSQAASPLPP